MNEGLVEDWAQDAETFQAKFAQILAGGFGDGFSAQVPEIVTVTFLVQSNQTSIDLTVLHESLKFLAEYTSNFCKKIESRRIYQPQHERGRARYCGKAAAALQVLLQSDQP
jgi:hypothetical protein